MEKAFNKETGKERGEGGNSVGSLEIDLPGVIYREMARTCGNSIFSISYNNKSAQFNCELHCCFFLSFLCVFFHSFLIELVR